MIRRLVQRPRPDGDDRPLSQRLVDRASTLLAGPGLSRRGFLTRTAIVGSALAVEPWGFILKPGTAYASVCGSANRCSDGWTAFCCTISDGANTCPPGAYAAGWWKVDDSAFCNGDARYYIDCNRLPDASCSCECSSDPCDGRRICCNVFRYGQCNPQIGGVTEVVCRVILCTPPWEWDPSCTTTVRTDRATASHSSRCLPGPHPSPIEVAYQDLGMTASLVGRQVSAEVDAHGGGRLAAYTTGLILWSEPTGAHPVAGAAADRYEELGRERSALGYPTAGRRPVEGHDGAVTEFEGGAIWEHADTGAHETTGGVHERYLAEGGPAAWLGLPVTGVRTVPDGRVRSDFSSGWSIVHRPSDGATRLLPADEPLPEDGSWPPRPRVERLSGRSRVETAVMVSRAVFPRGVPIAFVSRTDGFADALTGGVAAARLGGPILLTATASLDPRTAEELDRLRPGRVVVLGGPAAVSARVVRALERYGATERWAGPDRFATAVEISRRGAAPDGADVVHVTAGDRYAEALAAAPAAAAAGGPVLLVSAEGVPNVVRQELGRLRPAEVVVVGGPRIVPTAVVDELRPYARDVRRVGSDARYTTAAAIAGEVTERGGHLVVTTGTDFPDGLAAAPVAGQRGGGVLLVRPGDIPGAAHRLLRDRGVARITVVGGDRAVDDSVLRRLESYPVRT